jgi:hypothetical protein
MRSANPSAPAAAREAPLRILAEWQNILTEITAAISMRLSS